MKIHRINDGFCNITYKTKNADNQTIFYCLQSDFPPDIKAYRATQEFEPMYEVKPTNWALWEIPSGDSTIEQYVRTFLQSKE